MRAPDSPENRSPYLDLAGRTARLDNRNTQYRFDLEADLPWAMGTTGDLHVPPHLLESLGVSPRLEEHPQAWALFQWAAGLEICESFSALEQYLLDFVDAEHTTLGPTRSALLLYQEERKHIALFDRYAALLREAEPGWVDAFEEAFAPNRPVLLHPYTQDAYAGQEAVQHYFFWLKTLFFEEYTLYLDDRLQAEAARVKPLWLAAHRCHRKEEQQHVVTDLVHIEALDLDDLHRRACATTFWAHLEQTFELFLGVAAAKRLVRERFPPLAELLPSWPARELPVFRDLRTHPSFKGMRKHAPPPRAARAPAMEHEPQATPELVGPEQAPCEDTLVDRLVIAAKTPHGITWISERAADRFQSYEALLTEATRVVDGLRTRGLDAGDRVILAIERPDLAVPLLWGCFCAGIVPALVSAATQDADRLEAVRAHLGAPIVGDAEAEALLRHQPLEAPLFSPSGVDGVALIQFSSGSTAEPRGVELTHRNLVANTRAIYEHLGGRTDDRFLSWLPLSHDMGLVGYHLLPIVFGLPQALLRPRHFLKRPADWLRAMSRLGTNVSATPTFGLATVVDRLGDVDRVGDDDVASLDLRPLRTLLLGAEPISAVLMDRFTAVLAPARLQAHALTPGYGLAEATLCVTGRREGEDNRILRFARDSLHGDGPARPDPNGVAVVGVGTPLPGMRLRIVGDGGRPVPAGAVGEIEVQGPSVTRGYTGEGRPAAQFRGQWLRTGDLGLLADGQLFVTGRREEVLFVEGRKLYAHDVEAAIGALDGVHPRRVAVFGSRDPASERQILCVAVALRGSSTGAIVERIAAEVGLRFGVRPDHVFCVGARDIERTSSGKLRRHALRRRFERGELGGGALAPEATNLVAPDAVAPNAAPSNAAAFADRLRPLVRAAWARALGLPEGSEAFGDDQDFRTLGGSSVKAAMVHATLEDALGRALPHEVVLGATTVAELVAALGDVEPITTPSAAPAIRALPSRSTAVAIIGLGVRLPGADTPAAFWEMLEAGRDRFEPVPAERWDHDTLRAGDPTLCPTGSFVDGVFDFDPGAFGLADAEAAVMEPRQRLLLEAAAEALRDAGIGAEDVGVFVSQGENPLNCRSFLDDLRNGDRGVAGRLENITNSMTASRVSRAFGLTGPATVVQAACASTVVAIHHARLALLAGDCDAAVVGGVEITHSPTTYALFGPNRVLSPSGRCVPFCPEADGFVPGEGAAAVVLTRLDRALERGDRILAIIRGSGVSSDGRGLTGMAPNPAGQAAAARRALSEAGVRPESIGMIEAHGAATAVGDAVELSALRSVYGESGALLTSVKSNLGHLFSAAGIAAVVKTVLALRHGVIPPIANFTVADPRHRFADTGLRPASVATPWGTESPSPRRAAVSSVGIGGVNAHLILEEAPPPSGATMPGLITLAGRSVEAVRRDAGALLAAVGRPPLEALSAALCRRAAPERRVRIATAVSSTDEALAFLADVAAGRATPTGSARKLVVVFPGPGTTPGVPCVSIRDTTAFREAIAACESILEPRLGLGVDALFAAAGRRIDYAQAATFALSWASWSWLRSIGISADAVIGHSAGEYAAAAAAGALSMEDALNALIARGEAMAQTAEGTMAAIFGDEARMEEAISGTGVEVAAYNGPRQRVISGARYAMSEAVARLETAGIRVTFLAIPCAAHSVIMAPAQAPLRRALEDITIRPFDIPLISTLTGARLERLSVEHLVEQLRAPVDFEGAVRFALGAGYGCFAEVGPAAVLSPAISATVAGKDATVVGLHRITEGPAATLRAVATLFEAGQDVRAGRLSTGDLDLPPVPMARRRYPIPFAEAQANAAAARAGGTTSRPEAPASATAGRSGGTTSGSDAGPQPLSHEERAIFDDHRAGGEPIAPAAWMLDRLLASRTGAPTTLQNVTITAPARPSLDVYAVDTEGDRVTLRSRTGDAWTTHVTATWAADPGELAAAPAERGERLDPTELYATIAAGGLTYGPTLRTLAGARVDGDELWADLRPGAPLGSVRIDPTVLDGAFQALIGLIAERVSGREPMLGFAIRRLSWLRPVAGPCRAYVRLHHVQEDGLRCDITITDALGRPCLRLDDFAARRSPKPRVIDVVESVAWQPVDLAAAPRPDGLTAIVGDGLELARDLLRNPAATVLGPVPAAAAEVALHQAARVVLVSPSIEDLRTLAGAPGQATWRVVTSSRSVAAMARALGAERNRGPVGVVLADEPLPANAVWAALASQQHPVLRWDGSFAAPHRREIAAAERPLVREQGIYWLLGGTGGIGAALAAALLERGAATVVLSGRRAELPAELAVRFAGARVDYVPTDLANADQTGAALATIVRRHGRLDGVIHSAGILDDGPLAGRSAERMEAVLAAKERGARALERALGDTPLDFVAFVSSLTSLVPSPGQADYAAANGTLDDAALRWKGPAERVVSIAYGPWGEVGRVATPEHRERLRAAGLVAHDTATGVRAFFSALGSDARHVVAVSVPEARIPDFDVAIGIPRAPPVHPPSRVMAPAPALPRTTGAAAPADASSGADAPTRGPERPSPDVDAVLIGVLRERVPLESLSPSLTFAELGIDSISGVQMVRTLEARLGLTLHATLLFEHPTVGDLLFELKQRLTGRS